MTAQIFLLLLSGGFFYEAFFNMKGYKATDSGKITAIIFGSIFLLLCIFWDFLPG